MIERLTILAVSAVLLAANGVFVAAEFALLSAPVTRLERLANALGLCVWVPRLVIANVLRVALRAHRKFGYAAVAFGATKTLGRSGRRRRRRGTRRTGAGGRRAGRGLPHPAGQGRGLHRREEGRQAGPGAPER